MQSRSIRRSKKESTGHRLNRRCPPYAKPSSNSSLDHRRGDAALPKMDLQRAA